jgi:hypothetical protein
MFSDNNILHGLALCSYLELASAYSLDTHAQQAVLAHNSGRERPRQDDSCASEQAALAN